MLYYCPTLKPSEQIANGFLQANARIFTYLGNRWDMLFNMISDITKKQVRFKTNIKHYLARNFGRYIYILTAIVIEGSLEVKLPTIWTDGKDRWKSRGGKNQRGEEQKREDQRRERVRRKKMQVREKVEKSRFIVFSHWFVAAEGRKVGSLKRRVRAIWPDERWKIARRCGTNHICKWKS